MFTLLNPLLVWGLAAIAAPILIHLLLRQRPRPRAWAAMRWLQAAMQAAQRRYKLTNLLLLLLRCLAIALLALAMSRPSLAGFGRGGRLVLVVDTSASMGATGEDGGALAELRTALAEASIHHGEVALVTVDERVQLRDLGDADTVLTTADSLTTTPLPGGLARAATGQALDHLLEACTPDSDVVLVSDFRQDTGDELVAVLETRVRSVTRWRVGRDGANALVTRVLGTDDLIPGMPGTLALELAGPAKRAELAVDGGMPLPVELLRSGDRARIGLPPLEAGEHLLRLHLSDTGLSYDDLLELPVLVRPTVEAVVIAARSSRLQAALEADSGRVELSRLDPTALSIPLPSAGIVFARSALRSAETLAPWVERGGVLWVGAAALDEHPRLAALQPALQVLEEARAGGALRTGHADLDPSLSRVSLETLPTFSLPPEADVLLWAGEDPLVVAVPAGRGVLVVEALPLEEAPNLGNAGAFPLWIRRCVRQLTARVHLPRQWQAGQPVPSAAVLQREGRELQLEPEQLLMAEPGLWRGQDGADVVVLPSRAEGLLQSVAGREVVDSLAEALPRGRGADWGLGLLIAALAVLMLEGVIAAWAGRAYGR